MIRGTVYASVAAALAITVSMGVDFPFGLIFWGFAWMLVLIYTGFPLMLSALIVQSIQGKLSRVMKGRLFVPAAILSAVPFGLLICFTFMKLAGWNDRLASPQDWIDPLRVGIAGGLGLGWGCVRGDLPHD
jgi:hypothetical protein